MVKSQTDIVSSYPCKCIGDLFKRIDNPNIDTVNCSLDDKLNTIYYFTLVENPFQQNNAITSLMNIYRNSSDTSCYLRKSIIDTMLYSLENNKSVFITSYFNREMKINDFNFNQIHRICQIFLKGYTDMDLISLIGILDRKQLIPELKSIYYKDSNLPWYEKEIILNALCRMGDEESIGIYLSNFEKNIKSSRKENKQIQFHHLRYIGNKFIIDSLIRYFYHKDQIIFLGEWGDEYKMELKYNSFLEELAEELEVIIPDFPKGITTDEYNSILPEPKRLQVIEWYEKNKDTYTVKQWPEGRSK